MEYSPRPENFEMVGKLIINNRHTCSNNRIHPNLLAALKNRVIQALEPQNIKRPYIVSLVIFVLGLGVYFLNPFIFPERWEGSDSVMEFGGLYKNEPTCDFFVSFIRSGPMSFSSGKQMLNLYDKEEKLILSLETHPWFVNSLNWDKSVPEISLICVHKECGCIESKKELIKISSVGKYQVKWSFQGNNTL